MRAKDPDGAFRPEFSDTRWGLDYAEGSAWQSSFAVYHDFAGLIAEHGGKAAFEAKLIDLCNQEPRYTTEGYGFEIHEIARWLHSILVSGDLQSAKLPLSVSIQLFGQTRNGTALDQAAIDTMLQ